MHYLALIVAAALAAANPIDRAQLKSRQAPPANLITIANLTTSGSGCPTGSVSTSLSTDGTIVTLGFNSFQTYIGPGTSIQSHSKNCQLHLSLEYPGGFEYSVVDAVYHGYAQLDAGVTGTFLSTYFFSQSASTTTTTRSTISGPAWLSGNTYTKEDQVPSISTIWSPCGDTGILNINNRVSLAANTTTEAGQLTDDDATVTFTHQIHVAWQACNLSGSSSGSGSFTTGLGTTAITPREADATAPDTSSPTSIFWIGPGSTTITPSGTTEPCDPSNEFCLPGGTTTTISGGEADRGKFR